jgi:limonene 1,2-monooxygenase
MMEESLEAILALLDGSEPVTRETDWFTLRDARLQLRPYTHPRFEVCVAAQVSPAGPRAAGRFGCGLLSIGATSRGGFDVLGSHWSVMQERAEEFGLPEPDRRQWRLVGPMHIAETQDQARKDVAYGLEDWMGYFQKVAALPLAPDADDLPSMIDAMNGSGMSVIGTPEQAIAQVQRLIDQSGGFGTFLFMANDWADREAMLRSYELFAREVMPHFQGKTSSLVASRDWAAENRPTFIGAAGQAVMKAIGDHNAEKQAKAAAKDGEPAKA